MKTISFKYRMPKRFGDLSCGKKRAQAAVELLTTYGWARIAVSRGYSTSLYVDIVDAKDLFLKGATLVSRFNAQEHT
jgi:hypothetical protein